MKKTDYTFTSSYHKIVADTLTPVSVYLKLRDHFPGSLLLESSDIAAMEVLVMSSRWFLFKVKLQKQEAISRCNSVTVSSVSPFKRE